MPRPAKRRRLPLCLNNLAQIDWLLIFLIVGLTSLGGLMIRSAEFLEGSVD